MQQNINAVLSCTSADRKSFLKNRGMDFLPTFLPDGKKLAYEITTQCVRVCSVKKLEAARGFSRDLT
jgi:hypothetical protein